MCLPDGRGGGHATGDTFTTFEHLTGSNWNDKLTGNGAANTLIGGAGDDLRAVAAGEKDRQVRVVSPDDPGEVWLTNLYLCEDEYRLRLHGVPVRWLTRIEASW